ncbi:MAG: hypothetical protein JWO77_969 [Ilumatobacteraceae bacterium]|nr:hypothetical protein [Ilumatobacteraceae bacterium]
MPMPPEMSFATVHQGGDHSLITVTGEVDHRTAPHLSTAAGDLLAGGQRHLRFDLSGVTFFDAGGVRALQVAVRQARRVDGTVTVVAPPPFVVQVLEVLGLGGLVELGSGAPAPTVADRRLAILARLTDLPSDDAAIRSLGEICAEVTEMTGAGIMLMAGGAPQASVGVTNAAGELIERLQYELGEGPCVDAHALDRPVLAPDLAAPRELRWPAFRGPVLDAGVRAIFGFPMRVGGVRLGALNLHRDTAGPLTDDQHANALVVASIAAEVILALQAEAPPGRLSASLEAETESQLVVHQATGRIAVQLDVPIAEAMVRLRAHAFATDRSIRDIAAEVVDGTLRFDRTDPGEPS